MLPRAIRLCSSPRHITMLHRAMATATATPPQGPHGDKLIFAPGENSPDTNTPARAAQFQLARLHRSDLDADPFSQFHQWFSSPHLKGHAPETVTLATASLPTGRVSSRIVYLKELDSRGFVIYSNFGTSRKAADIATNPYASLSFWWKPLERQVRVEGKVERLSADESQVYFNTRARGSRIGAWASQQTSVLNPLTDTQGERGDRDGNGDEDEDDGRADLESRVKQVEARFQGQDVIPVPPFWGGLRIIPDTIEFWQGRESRLHDRFRYTRLDDPDAWKVERLSP